MMWLAAIALGFVSSLHCVGMCGPLALLINGATSRHVMVNRLLYNAGRIVTYGILGLVMGLVGSVIQMGGMQNVMSVSLGLLIFVFLLFPRLEKFMAPGVNRFLMRVKQALPRQMRRTHPVSAFTTGLLNGILPCSMVYMALTFAIIQPTLLSSVIFMTAFGTGTLPAMIISAYALHWLKQYSSVSLKKIQTIFLVVMAVVMIGRGVYNGHSHGIKDHHGVTVCD